MLDILTDYGLTNAEANPASHMMQGMRMGKDWICTLCIGFLVTSYWRGTWTLFDIWLCDQPADATLPLGNTFCLEDMEVHRDSGWKSYIIGMCLTISGVVFIWTGAWRPNVVLDGTKEKQIKITPFKAFTRFIIVYILGLAAVNLWRGVWYLTDWYLIPDHVTTHKKHGGEWTLVSFWVSSVVGSTVCFILQSGASLLAPPAIFLLDGPGVNPPPLAVTVMSSYYSLTLPAKTPAPELPLFALIGDIILSFVVVPIFVVWFWRGSWLVLDFYLWGFAAEPYYLHMSLLWSTLLALGLMIPTSETVVTMLCPFVPEKINQNATLLALLGRLRTFLLAWGTVNFWRVVWYIWDEFLPGGTSQWSCWISHAVPVLLLTCFGCVSCIVAPASTLGVDAVPHPDAADEPLFSNLPVPADDLYIAGIERQPTVIDAKTIPETARSERDSHIKKSVLISSVVELTPTTEEEKSDEEDKPAPQAEEQPPVQQGIEQELTASQVEAAVQQRVDFDYRMSREETTHAWSTAGTGRHAAYSSVRLPSERAPVRSSTQRYLEMQRPDLDRRVPRSAASQSLRMSGISSARSSQSSLYRSR